MAYGLRVRDADSNIILDTTDRITRQRYSNEVAADADGNTVLADIDGLETIEFSVKLEKYYYKCEHTVARSGTTISWTHNDVGGKAMSSASLIFVFLY